MTVFSWFLLFRPWCKTNVIVWLALIERWHGRGRLGYSLTPRFAPTSTREQLQATGELFAAFPDLHLIGLDRDPNAIAGGQPLVA